MHDNHSQLPYISMVRAKLPPYQRSCHCGSQCRMRDSHRSERQWTNWKSPKRLREVRKPAWNWTELNCNFLVSMASHKLIPRKNNSKTTQRLGTSTSGCASVPSGRFQLAAGRFAEVAQDKRQWFVRRPCNHRACHKRIAILTFFTSEKRHENASGSSVSMALLIIAVRKIGQRIPLVKIGCPLQWSKLAHCGGLQPLMFTFRSWKIWKTDKILNTVRPMNPSSPIFNWLKPSFSSSVFSRTFKILQTLGTEFMLRCLFQGAFHVLRPWPMRRRQDRSHFQRWSCCWHWGSPYPGHFRWPETWPMVSWFRHSKLIPGTKKQAAQVFKCFFVFF